MGSGSHSLVWVFEGRVIQFDLELRNCEDTLFPVTQLVEMTCAGVPCAAFTRSSEAGVRTQLENMTEGIGKTLRTEGKQALGVGCAWALGGESFKLLKHTNGQQDLEGPVGLSREKVSRILCLEIVPGKEAGPGAFVQLC